MSFRKTAVVALALFSPFVAEFLLGDQYLAGRLGEVLITQQLGMFAMFVALYGSAAVLIREVARRRGRGWPTILTLALAFGVVEEGLLTQTLFNPHYLGLDLLSPAHVPGLGIGGQWTVFVLTLHVVWSIASPIAIAEAFFGREPWLRRPGTVAWTCALLVGGAGTFLVSRMMGTPAFLAAPGQLVGAAVVAVALVVFALRLPVRALDTRGSAWAGFAVGLGASTLFHLVDKTALLHSWGTVALMLALEAAVVAYAVRCRPSAFSLAAGAIVTYCWVGLLTAAGNPVALIEQVVLVAATLSVLALAARRRIPVNV
ncbi:hypothetical protein ABZU76_05295 [Amycolatopsis sp. NPDC005232]|uniref:hypothetical protein n=1 Tax=Amycolatopsis sp. NPDC005232 TaxID=3157027 RepID=UPI0033B78DC6